MLHELLLALSGHPSPLLDGGKNHNLQLPPSSSEIASLKSIANLGSLQIKLRTRTSSISSSHPSVVCRAIAAAIAGTHLANFQNQILSVERSILQENVHLIGAYEAVPLSSIAGAFDGWQQILEWLQELVEFLAPTTHSTKSDGRRRASSAEAIDRLRRETRTGYPDFEQIAISLATVAESTWLQQVSAWVLYGWLPTLGARDFFVQQVTADDAGGTSYSSFCKVEMTLMPSFVTPRVANTILFIGNSINFIRDQAVETRYSQLNLSSTSLLSTHLGYLASLAYPINSASFSRVIGAIRTSICQNALQKLLPTTEVLQILNILRSFFLLDRGDFAIALVAAADDCLATRQRQFSVGSVRADVSRLGGITIKEGEVAGILTRSWISLHALQGIEDDIDEELDLAQKLVRLLIKPPANSVRPVSFISFLGNAIEIQEFGTTFSDTLFATPISLSISLPSPLDLFLSSVEIDTYSHIHAYLLSVRRAHLRLTELWKLNLLRRSGTSAKTMNGSAERRHISSQGQRRIRSTWAVVSAAAYFLAELGEYLQGEVVVGSWIELFNWLVPASFPRGFAHHATASLGSSTSTRRPQSSSSLSERSIRDLVSHSTPRSPEILAMAHRCYLTALIHWLLLDDERFTRLLRAFMTKVDHVVALVERLNMVPQTVEPDIEVPLTDASNEKGQLMNTLTDVGKEIQDGLDGLVKRLKEIEFERLGSDMPSLTPETEETGFVPFKGNRVYRLLTKLDFVSFAGMKY